MVRVLFSVINLCRQCSYVGVNRVGVIMAVVHNFGCIFVHAYELSALIKVTGHRCHHDILQTIVFLLLAVCWSIAYITFGLITQYILCTKLSNCLTVDIVWKENVNRML